MRYAYIPPLLMVALLMQSDAYARTLIQYEVATDKGCKIIDYHDTSKPDSKKTSKATWSGSCRSGYADGNGSLRTENAEGTIETSNGKLVKGKFEGGVTSEALRKDGSKTSAKAIFIGGLPNGYCEATMTLPSGQAQAYSGQMKDGLPNGAGMVTTHYSVITGEFSDGNPVGIMTLVPTNASWTYEGKLLKGKPDGKGIFTYKDNTKITINIQNDKPDLIGKIEYPNGGTYEGELRAMRPEGKGRVVTPDGSLVEGNFKNGRIDGDAVLSNKNGTFEVTYIDGKPTKRNNESPSQNSPVAQSKAAPTKSGWEVLGSVLDAFAGGIVAGNQAVQSQTAPAAPQVIYVPTPQQPSVPQNNRAYCRQVGKGVDCNSY